MAVAKDNSSLWSTATGASPITLTLNVGASANALAALIACGSSGSGFPPGIAVTWDAAGTNQALSLVPGTTISDAILSSTCAVYGLLAPTTGNLTLTVSWTGGGSFEMHILLESLTGVDQGSFAGSFLHGNTASGTSTTSSVTITSATGNQAIAGHAQNVGFFNTTNGTTLDIDNTGGNIGVAGNYDAGAASVTLTATIGSSGLWNAYGCDILAATGVTFTPTDFPYWPDFTSTKSSTAAFDLQAFPKPLLPPPAPWGVKNYWIDFFKRKPQAPDLGSQAILKAVAPPPAPWGVKNYWPDFATRKPRTTDLGSQAILEAVAPPPAPWGVKNYWIDFFKRRPQAPDLGSQAILKSVAPPPAPWATEVGWPEIFKLTIKRDYNGYYFVQVVTVAPDVVTFSGGLMPMMGVG